MIRLRKIETALALGAALALAGPAAAETYSMKPHLPCVPSQAGGCSTPVPSPPGWKCHWSMDLAGKELKTILVDSLGTQLMDATLCNLKACTAACNKTSGCIAVDVMKPSMIDGQWNTQNECVCTLFGSVTSATKFAEIRAPVEKMLSGWACLRLPKRPPPPMRENPNFPGAERPGVEQDRLRPGTTGTPGGRR